jgi:hypothetical protein
MKTLDEIATEILKKTNYSQDVIKFHLERIARKFDYELFGKNQDMLSAEDAADVSSITARFLQDRKGHEARKDDATQLISIVQVNPVSTTTKPLPIVRNPKAPRGLFSLGRKKNS